LLACIGVFAAIAAMLKGHWQVSVGITFVLCLSIVALIVVGARSKDLSVNPADPARLARRPLLWGLIYLVVAFIAFARAAMFGWQAFDVVGGAITGVLSVVNIWLGLKMKGKLKREGGSGTTLFPR